MSITGNQNQPLPPPPPPVDDKDAAPTSEAQPIVQTAKAPVAATTTSPMIKNK
ncbi:MAG: hypothetical protein ACYCUX_10100 [Metallibacterium sp.]